MLARGRDRRAVALTGLVVLVALVATNGSGTTARPVATPASAAPQAGAPPTVAALEGPASVTADPSAVPMAPLVRDAAVSQVGSPSDIPSLALGAYQRADSVLGTADAACRLPWTLVAAIGRVESDHGRHDGSALDDQGVARPAIVGVRLDGSGGTARLRDSDAGVLDDDKRFDRAVGPMQFIPSTWAVVGVDADSDGARDPQDIDDAALAAGVYLCAGDEDLSTESGLRTAVHRYNHSDEYVDLVLRIMAAYERSTTLAGAFTTEAVDAFDPRITPAPREVPTDGPTDEPSDGPTDDPTERPTPDPDPDPDPGPTPTPTASPTPAPSEPVPSPSPRPSEPAPSPTPSEPAPSPTPSEPTPSPTPSEPSPTPSEPAPSPTPTPTPSEPTPSPTPTEPPSDEAEAACTELGYVDDPADPDDEFDQCVADHELYVEVHELCTGLGYVDDPEREDDDFDRCVADELAAREPE